MEIKRMEICFFHSAYFDREVSLDLQCTFTEYIEINYGQWKTEPKKGKILGLKNII
jgi:hypothetical protein